MRKHKKSTRVLMGALAVSALFAGSAFTDANDMTAADGLVGYGTVEVSGATVASLVYNLDATGTNVESVDLALLGDTSGSTAAIGFNDGDTTDCGVGLYDTTTNTDYVCTVSTGTAGLTSTEVVVN